jgi:hypothetical protein
LGKGDAIFLRISEVEYLVLPDRQAKRGSELVLVVCGDAATVRGPVRRIEFVIADVFPQITVDLVGARLDAGAEYGSL